MDPLLRSRISALIGEDLPMEFQQGGEVDSPEMVMPDLPAETMPEDPSAGLEQAIGALMRERDMSDDPAERALLESVTENMEVASQAPMSEQAMMLAEQGRGGDTRLAHLRVGEVVLPPEAFDDAQFESAVERKFEELDLDPEAYVVGAGIASLNPITGLEEFGWFKKTFKSIKKVAKKVAPLAMFIPGVGSAIGAALGGIGGLAGGVLGTIPGMGQIGGLIKGGLSGIGSLGIPGLSPMAEAALQVGKKPGSFMDVFSGAVKNPFSGGIFGARSSKYGGTKAGSDFFRKAMDTFFTTGSTGSKDTDEKISDALKEAIEGADAQGLEGQARIDYIAQKIASSYGAGGYGLGNLGMLGNLGILGLSGALGKLAYDEAKNSRGVPLTPLTQEGATGRYNIEAEIARRTGQPAPNPVEFGLLPTGTLPTLSGGRPTPVEEEEEAVMTARYGGPVMAFAAGGNVAKKDFVEMDGKINGPGTEVSDDIPAMLSDGEFVMTGQAVRGAGAFDLAKGDGGIITLTPNGSESRDKGTNLMYEMMDLFSEFADKPKSERAAA